MTSHKDQGLSILDIGPLSENVPLTGDKSLKVFGISAKGMFSVFQRFPEVGKWFKGANGTAKVDMRVLIAEVPDTIAAVIAAGCGEPGNEIAETNAALLPVEIQLDAIEAIMRLTFKSGFGPFVQRMVALSEQAKSLSFGKASDTTLPPGSKPASPQATAPNTSGI